MRNFRKKSIFLVLFLAVSLSSIASGATIIVAEITADKLNIRAQPSISGKIIGSFKQGEQVTALSEHPGWLTVSVNGNASGYISVEYIKVLKVIFSKSDTPIKEDEFMTE